MAIMLVISLDTVPLIHLALAVNIVWKFKIVSLGDIGIMDIGYGILAMVAARRRTLIGNN